LILNAAEQRVAQPDYDLATIALTYELAAMALLGQSFERQHAESSKTLPSQILKRLPPNE
jgi:hypothetical protein